ncbi:MAG: thioredoxin domain-containing protein [Sphingomonas sp.]|uniref:thioredoxin domain-containing protein n=1 Tax=Sphingomonas sp. TaxID=28214 RepID=UPI001ACF60B2|nr:thioredoxin domain-containing protein [Sphingomonas sp.]MBN8809007.1 thioredoxin domain-containing protein [Sphingomonas sp.]
MQFRSFLAAVPLILAAACSGGGSGGSGNASAPAGSVPVAKAPAGTDWLTTVVKTPEGGMRMGNPDAPIKLIEYGSRTCPVCGAFGREGTQPLEKNYVATGKVSWEFREYLVHGQPDIPAALLGTCVPAATFFPILEQMYINQGPVEDKMGGPEGQALFQKLQSAPPQQVATEWAALLGYVDFFKQRGLPEDKARACLADAGKVKQIMDGMNAANAKGVTGTPSFFIDDEKVDAITWPQLEAVLKARGA